MPPNVHKAGWGRTTLAFHRTKITRVGVFNTPLFNLIKNYELLIKLNLLNNLLIFNQKMAIIFYNFGRLNKASRP